MSALDFLPADEPLTAIPRFAIEPRDKGDASEAARQSAFRRALYMRAPHVESWGVPNGGLRGFKAQRRAKAEGMTAGVFDEHYAWNHGIAFLEWKDGTGKPTPAQIDWGNMMVARGFRVACVRSVDFAMSLMAEWGAL